MAACTGLIYGIVWDERTGQRIGGADVSLNFIFGDYEQGEVRTGTTADKYDTLSGYPRAVTGSDGRYVMPFLWNGTDIAKVVGGVATASILVMKQATPSTYRSKNMRLRLLLGLDLKKLILTGYTDPTGSPSDFVSVAKDFYASYKDMLPKHGVFPTIMPFSTDVFGLVGRGHVAM